jgi:hypothetical protein
MFERGLAPFKLPRKVNEQSYQEFLARCANDFIVYDCVLYDFIVYDCVVYDFILYDFIVYDFIVYDFIVYDFIV